MSCYNEEVLINKSDKVSMNVALRRVRLTIFAVEKQ